MGPGGAVHQRKELLSEVKVPGSGRRNKQNAKRLDSAQILPQNEAGMEVLGQSAGPCDKLGIILRSQFYRFEFVLVLIENRAFKDSLLNQICVLGSCAINIVFFCTSYDTVLYPEGSA